MRSRLTHTKIAQCTQRPLRTSQSNSLGLLLIHVMRACERVDDEGHAMTWECLEGLNLSQRQLDQQMQYVHISLNMVADIMQ